MIKVMTGYLNNELKGYVFDKEGKSCLIKKVYSTKVYPEYFLLYVVLETIYSNGKKITETVLIEELTERECLTTLNEYYDVVDYYINRIKKKL